MRSRNVDRFNHDVDAPSYDSDVANEADPIRAGYSELLRWVSARADVDGADVIELGAGTGNLTTLLNGASSIEAVDASAEMLSLLRKKCGDARVRCHQADLLGYFDEPRMADLGEAGQPQFGGSAIGGRNQLVEAVDVGADGDQDHSSGPEATTARGKVAALSGHCTTKRSANG